MKYEFIKITDDVNKLKYKDKEFEFKTNVKLISEMQGLIAEARIQMIQDFAKKGQSIKDLTIEVKKDGKTYYDNSNKQELENIYNEKLTLEFFNNKCKELFKMDLVELMNDVGLETEEETTKFASELVNYLSGKTPSK
jgi:ribosomal protein L24E